MSVHAKLFNASAVLVSWERVSLPEGVQLLEYLVYARHTHQQQNKLKEEGEFYQWRFSAESDRGLVTGLSSHARYSFSVTALIEDYDGTVFETSKSSESHVFVPGKR